MRIYCYRLLPIDFWPGTFPYESSNDEAARLFELSKRIARDKLGWPGDIREGPYLFSLPDVPSCQVGLAWKEDNGGTTYVFSPRPLPWLMEFADAWAVVDA